MAETQAASGQAAAFTTAADVSLLDQIVEQGNVGRDTETRERGQDLVPTDPGRQGNPERPAVHGLLPLPGGIVPHFVRSPGSTTARRSTTATTSSSKRTSRSSVNRAT